MTDQAPDPETLLAALDDVVANANRLAAGVGEDHWQAATPCTDWNVRELTNHMAGSARFLAAAARRSAPSAPSDGDHLGDDPVAALQSATTECATAWRTPGTLDGTISQPFEAPAVVGLGITILDLGVHCWDLAVATDQDHGLTDDQIRLIDGWNRRIITDDARAAGAFAPVQPGADSGGLNGMLAFTGRQA